MNYRLLTKTIFFSFVAVFITSCTDIIDVNVNSSEPQLVVEASVGLDEFALVKLSKSVNLNAVDSFPNVSNAVITITDGEGSSEVLVETNKPGSYVSRVLKGRPGKTYSITVKVENKTVTGSSKIPTFVPVDSMDVKRTVYPGGGAPVGNQEANFYELTLHFSDPANERNFYRFLLFINKLPVSGNNIMEDRFMDGKNVDRTLILYNKDLKTGDTISVEMQCIDTDVYNYFESMGNSAMGPRNASSPANPYTNLTGTILGFFSAHTVQRKDWVLK